MDDVWTTKPHIHFRKCHDTDVNVAKAIKYLEIERDPATSDVQREDATAKRLRVCLTISRCSTYLHNTKVLNNGRGSCFNCSFYIITSYSLYPNITDNYPVFLCRNPICVIVYIRRGASVVFERHHGFRRTSSSEASLRVREADQEELCIL